MVGKHSRAALLGSAPGRAAVSVAADGDLQSPHVRRRDHRRRAQRARGRGVPRAGRAQGRRAGAAPRSRRGGGNRGGVPRLPVQRGLVRRLAAPPRDRPGARAAGARPRDPASRRNVHAARRRLPVACERPRPHRARAPTLVGERRGGVRGVQPPDVRDGEVRQADPVHGAAGPRPARSARMAPRRTSRPLLQRPLPGAAGGVHPAHDDERRRLPRPVVRDGSAEGDDERLRDHRHVPGDPLSWDRVRPAAPLHGRDRRRPARLGNTARRDRRRQRGDRERRPVVRRRDPDRDPRRALPDPRRRGDRRRHVGGRRGDRAGDAVEPGPAADVRPAPASPASSTGRSSRRSRATGTGAPAGR